MGKNQLKGYSRIGEERKREGKKGGALGKKNQGKRNQIREFGLKKEGGFKGFPSFGEKELGLWKEIGIYSALFKG